MSNTAKIITVIVISAAVVGAIIYFKNKKAKAAEAAKLAGANTSKPPVPAL